MSTQIAQNELASKKNDCCVQVAVRVRPFVSKELIESEGSCIKTIKNKVIVGADKEFEFDRVIDQTSTQDEVYQQCMKDLLGKALEGYNATILAYGQTGSGKTYTMGTSNMNLNDESEMGIIPRVIRDIFNIRSEREKSVEMVLKISYFEIYNDNIIDLLDPNTITGNQAGGKKGKGANNNGQNVFIREEQDGSINIYGITEEKVNSAEEMLSALERGGLCRSTSATLMNQTSSRSHAVFTIFLEQHGLDNLYGSNVMENEEVEGIKQDGDIEPSLDEGFKTSKLHFVDLAGSERLKKTGAIGNTMKEGININMGLLSLGNVISALTEPSKNGAVKKHIPYRDSKLTRILQDSLGGNSNTLMVACVSPAESNFEESLNSLKYASRARRIKNKPIVNRDPQSAIISALKQQIQESHLEINKLRQILTENNIAVPKGISVIAGGQGYQDVEGNRRMSRDVLMTRSNGQINNNIMGMSSEADAEELKNLRINQVRLEKKIKELQAENGQLKSQSYKGEIDALLMQKERDELRLKLEKVMKIAKDKGIIMQGNENQQNNQMEVEVTGEQLENNLADITIDNEQKSLVEEYFANAEKMKKELQDKEKAFRELQGEFEDGIKASLRDQQMLVEREKKIAVLTRNLKNVEVEFKKAKEEIKKIKQDAARGDKQTLNTERTDSIESDEDDSEELEKMATDPELVQMESELKIEEHQKKIRLSKVDGSIKETSEKMRKLNSDQLELQQQLLAKMKEQYHSKINTLESDMRRIEHQRDEALQKMANNTSKEAIAEKQKVIETFKNKVSDMQSALGEYQKKAKEQETLQKRVSTQEKQISTLGSEITKFKALKTTLYKEMKKNNDEFEKFKAQKYKDIMLEKKKNIDKEKQIFKLTNQTRVQERILIKRQEDIKKLIKSRDLIKKIMSSSGNGNKQHSRLKLVKVNSASLIEEKEPSDDYILDECLEDLVQSKKILMQMQKQEEEMNATQADIEETQTKLIEFKLSLEKKEQLMLEQKSTNKEKDEEVEEESVEIQRNKMELEEMQSRLDSLEARFSFQKEKLQTLHSEGSAEEFERLQTQLLSSSRFNTLIAQKGLFSALLERFSASACEILQLNEYLEKESLKVKESQEYIEILQNQKEIYVEQLEELKNQQQQQLIQQKDAEERDESDSEYDISSCRHSSESKATTTHENDELPKISKSISIVLKHSRKMSNKDTRHAEISPLKREPQRSDETVRILQRQNNDLLRQLKLKEMHIKKLQNINEAIRQKCDDLKSAPCKDKFIGKTEWHTNGDTESPATQVAPFSAGSQVSQQIQQQSSGGGNFWMNKIKGIVSLKERRRDAKLHPKSMQLSMKELSTILEQSKKSSDNLATQLMVPSNGTPASSKDELDAVNNEQSYCVSKSKNSLNQTEVFSQVVSDRSFYSPQLQPQSNTDALFTTNTNGFHLNLLSATKRNSQESNYSANQNADDNLQANITCKYEKAGKIIDAHQGQVYCLESHENLLFSTSIRTLKIWDIESLKNVSEITAHSSFVKGLAIQKDGKWVATASDKSIHIWDMGSLSKVCTLTGSNSEIKQLQIGGEDLLYSVGRGGINSGALVTWDIRKQAVVEEREKNQDIFAVLPYNNTLFYASRDHFVRKINLSGNSGVDSFRPPHFDVVTSLAVLNGFLVSGSKDHNLKLWNTQVPISQADQHYFYSTEQLLCLESNRDSNLLYAGKKDGKVQIFTTLNDKLKDLVDIPNGFSSVNSIAGINSGVAPNMFACGTSDKIIKIWKPTQESQEFIHSLKQQN